MWRASGHKAKLGTQKVWLWANARDSRVSAAGPPRLVYRFEAGRGFECADASFAGFAGIFVADGYAAYNRLARSVGQ
ncbi:IS66 family transposase [Bradyrhizobium sp. USDA 4518]